MKLYFLNRIFIVLASRLKLIVQISEMVLCAAILFSCMISTTHAAIVWTGDVNPPDPTKWSSSYSLYIGQNSTGTVTVDGGSELQGTWVYLGTNSGSTGTATITGAGSKWTNRYNFLVGYSGSGTLNVEAGGQISCTGGYLGFYAGSTGIATITGAGSKWTNSGNLCVGNYGSGTLNVEAGGQISSYGGNLGVNAGSTGTVIITGTGSQWTNSGSLSVGNYGSGTLKVEAGGQISSNGGNLGVYAGSTGTATITGTGSKWTNSDSLYVGREGSGTLTVTNGGTVTVGKGLFASLNDLFGNGTISTNGGVLDVDLVFDATHGLQKTFAFGSGGTLNFNQDGTGDLGTGHKGNGTLRIADGITVSSRSGYLGYCSGSTGTATITGAGSKWTNSGNLCVGNYGSGTLNVEAGGQISSYAGYLGVNAGSTGTVIITGIGSKWTNSDSLYVGREGSGTLTVTNGGAVTVGKGLFASLNDLFGNGTISTNGGVLDVDLVFDATHGLQKTFAFGSGGTLNFNQDGTGDLGTGHKGNGTLRIADGITVSSRSGYLGYCSGSTGTATITGVGSKWTNSGNLTVGNYGSGTLKVEAGGQINSNGGYLGVYAGSTGTATITGAGSKWTNSSYIYVGSYGSGTLKVEAGGQISSKGGSLGDEAGSTGTAIITGTDSQWTNSGSLSVGYYGSGTLNIEAGGQVTNDFSYVGEAAGAKGTVTVDGTDSKWINKSILYVGESGNGTLKIEAGGQVSNTTGSLGYRIGCTGTATVTGVGSRWSNSSILYVGSSGNGTLNIEAGGQVGNTDGYVGYKADSTSTVKVNGTDSIWTNSGNLFVGYYGSGTLTVTDGGMVTVGKTLFASLNRLLGNGTISTNGAVLDADLVFDATHGMQQLLNFGSGGVLNINLDQNNELGAGYQGKGTLRIADGASAQCSNGYLGYLAGSAGTATVSGTGSIWRSTSLYIGYGGEGTLNVEAGGRIVTTSGTPSSYLGYNSGSMGTATITGAGSNLTISNLYVGYSGSGSLTVIDGGTVTIRGDLFASLNNLFGDGVISCNGGVLDADLVFDAAHEVQNTLGFGTGGTLIFNRNISTSRLGVGYKGDGTLRVAEGIAVSSSFGYLGYHPGSTGLATITGINSKWDNSGLYIGRAGNGILNIEAGGQVESNIGYLGDMSGASGTVTVTGTGSTWTNNGYLTVGNSGIGMLIIKAGGRISDTSDGYLGYDSGSSGSVTITGIGSQWNGNNNTSTIYIGYYGSGTLKIETGGQVNKNYNVYLGYNSSSTGTATVTGTGSTWTNSGSLTVGNSGIGTLNIEAGGQVSSNYSYLGYNSSSTGVATVSGTGSKWTENNTNYIGYSGSGTLKIETGGQVTGNNNGYMGYNSGSTGTVTVFGAGSKWTISNNLYVGNSGKGTLNIEAGGQVTGDKDGYLGYNPDATGTVTVLGAGSKWTISNSLYVGNNGKGTLDIETGGQVSSNNGYLGYYSANSTGTITVTGTNSTWINSNILYVGYYGNGILNIGSYGASDGLVKSKTLTMAQNTKSSGICNINGGTLQAGTITIGSGSTEFNWIDGTIRNFDANTNLIFSVNLVKLAATGTHTFNIDSGRTGTVNAILSDATSGGTLAKVGNGKLNLNAVNSYTGSTTITAGILGLSSMGSLASSSIDVGSGATFDVSAKTGGFTLGIGKTLQGSGTIVGRLTVNGIHAPGNAADVSTGIETVRGNYSMLGKLSLDLMGTEAGTGYDEVFLGGGTGTYNVSLGGTLDLNWNGMIGSIDTSKLWILKNDTAGTLSGMFGNYLNGAALGNYDGRDWYLWYGADAKSGNLTGGNDVVIAAVPEPSALVLLGIGVCSLISVWRRRNGTK